MKARIPLIVAIIIGLAIVSRCFKSTKYETAFDLETFASLPVQTGGRVLPIDSVARNSLRIISGKQTLRTLDTSDMSKEEKANANVKKLPAVQWLAESIFVPEKAHDYPVIRIDHPEVLGLLNIQQDKKKHFSYNDVKPYVDVLVKQMESIRKKEAPERSTYERGVAKLYNAFSEYFQINTLLHPGQNHDLVADEFEMWEATLAPGIQAFQQKQNNEAFDKELMDRFSNMTSIYSRHAESADVGLVPPRSEEMIESDHWANAGETLINAIRTPDLKIDPVLKHYAAMKVAYRSDDVETFNRLVKEQLEQLENDPSLQRAYKVSILPEIKIVNLANSMMQALGAVFGLNNVYDVVEFERTFNQAEPFYHSVILYVIIFIALCVFMIVSPEWLQKAAAYLMIITLVIHTYGLFARMFIQNRPPVTNLYSSAIFIGWASVLLAVFVERKYYKYLGKFVAAFILLIASGIGFVTLIIAHNLAKTGDTLEMMRAVLDSNFWLSTHVITITLGYAAMYLAGAIGFGYVLIGCVTKKIDKDISKILYSICYGIVCFCMLFSFVGTMLGGIWADQSWGRFWGWDPKENGALIIVLWCALMLHARWGGLVKGRGFMVLAIGGNIITSWSWFGVNMLGIGLHSYGFMDSAFLWLIRFCFIQWVVIAIGISGRSALISGVFSILLTALIALVTEANEVTIIGSLTGTSMLSMAVLHLFDSMGMGVQTPGSKDASAKA